MGRVPCCEKTGLKKGPWTPEEDQKLLAHIDRHGDGSWHALPIKAGLQRCGKSYRLRWINYLKPDIKRGKFSLQEEEIMIQLHALLGNRWSVIAAYLPKRTDNEIKNYWNTHVKKRLTKMGIDHVTHKPKSSSAASANSDWSLNHMTQWETARLQAEARLVRQSQLQASSSSSYLSKPSTVVVAPWQVPLGSYNGYVTNDAIFQTLSENVLVDPDHHRRHHQCYEKDVSLSICNDVTLDLEQDIIGNTFSGSESDHYHNGYGGNFENNNVITSYWDDNIMSLVDASAFPLDDAPFLL